MTATNESIFPSGGTRWADYLLKPTPIQRLDEVYYKREDHFAPLGYGGINGSKLRQCIWLVDRYVCEGGNSGLISGTSVKSPQLVMGSAVARHYGLPSRHVIGGTTMESALRHPSVAMATAFGATWDIIRVGYNPALQRRCRELLETENRGWFYLEYGITLQHSKHPPAAIEAFHRIGAEQVKNLPSDMDTLILPAGSCNTATSVIYGLRLYPPSNLKRVHLIGIGPSKLEWMRERLRIILAEKKLDPGFFDTDYPNRERVWDYRYHDLHGTGKVKYHDMVPWRHGNIAFHPTYEGKVMRYVGQALPRTLASGRTCVWIVGGQPVQGATATSTA